MTSELNAAAAEITEREKTINCSPLSASGMVFIDDAPEFCPYCSGQSVKDGVCIPCDDQRRLYDAAIAREAQKTRRVECVLYPWQREVISNLEKEAGEDKLLKLLEAERAKVKKLREALQDISDLSVNKLQVTSKPHLSIALIASIAQRNIAETAGE